VSGGALWQWVRAAEDCGCVVLVATDGELELCRSDGTVVDIRIDEGSVLEVGLTRPDGRSNTVETAGWLESLLAQGDV